MKAMASVGIMGCSRRIIFLVWEHGKGGRSPIRKAQNALSDYCWRAMYSLGNGDSRKVNQEMERGHLTKFWQLPWGSSSPLALRERVELKDGWPTVKVPYIMVWGYKCSFLSLFCLWGWWVVNEGTRAIGLLGGATPNGRFDSFPSSSNSVGMVSTEPDVRMHPQSS